MVISLDNNINNAMSWLLNSGIQNTKDDNTGSFNAWYDMSTGTYPFIYSEITGYGISTLVYANSINKDDAYKEHAKTAANWIINLMTANGNIIARIYSGHKPDLKYFGSNVSYTFDNGMVLSGLVSIYLATKDDKYLLAAIKIAESILKTQKSTGLFNAAYDAATGEYIDIQDKWSTQSGSYHAKLAIGLLDLYEATHNKIFKDAAVGVCNASLGLQADDGRFVTQQNENSTHMHPHCYSAEGLVYAGIGLGEKRFLDSALRAVKWALDNQLSNGGMPCKYVDGKFIEHERSDTLAQVLRLGVILKDIGLLVGYEKRLERLASRLVQFQNTSVDNSGGFFYGTELDGTKKPHLNSWVTMFSIQAMHMYNSYTKGERIELKPFV